MDHPKEKGKKFLRYGLYLVVIFLLIIVLPPLFYHQEINTLPDMLRVFIMSIPIFQMAKVPWMK